MIITKEMLLEANEKSEKWELSKLQALHHEILRLKIQGLSNIDIANMLDITPATVGNTVNSRLGQEKLALMQAAADDEAVDFKKKMTKLLPNIIKACENFLSDDPSNMTEDKIKLATAKYVTGDILGINAPTKIDSRHQHQHMHAILTTDQIEEMKQRGLAQAKQAGLISQ